MSPTVRRLGPLLAAMYFIQGIGEPSDGLLAQPMMSLLRSWQRSPQEIATFSAALVLPWALKPLYGLLVDSVPLFGSRRKSYLIASSLLSTIGFAALYVYAPQEPAPWLLLACLLVPALGVAFADVVIDALMVEFGQPTGTTGQLQSIQWSAIYAAAIITSLAGGELSQRAMYRLPLLICAVFSGAMLWMAVRLVEPPAIAATARTDQYHAAPRGSAWPLLLVLGTFIFLWHFNPFCGAVLYLHLTSGLGLSESFVGTSNAIAAVTALAACGLYAAYCRRLSARQLIHVSIGLGVIGTLCYAAVDGERSACIAAALFGFASTVATLAMLDLTAQVCPLAWAATVFATMMAVANLSMMLSTHLGGAMYQRLLEQCEARTAFAIVVATGAATTAACWLLVPMLTRLGSTDVK
ncbi:MAG TPA: MFS transporter [Pirellulales bacterium]|jgi:MFS family permease|nr:MFS transporter [Pirellulales bacterium]